MKAKSNHADFAAMSIRAGDLAKLPLADGSVDAAVANMVLHHVLDPAARLSEMARVTRQGGWVAING